MQLSTNANYLGCAQTRPRRRALSHLPPPCPPPGTPMSPSRTRSPWGRMPGSAHPASSGSAVHRQRMFRRHGHGTRSPAGQAVAVRTSRPSSSSLSARESMPLSSSIYLRAGRVQRWRRRNKGELASRVLLAKRRTPHSASNKRVTPMARTDQNKS
jgi:hypothetical protein